MLFISQKSDGGGLEITDSSHSRGLPDTSLASDRELARELELRDALSIGLGGMIGAGIFSVLGLAAGIAGPAVFLDFLIGGIIAILTGYSYTRLSLTYPSAGAS